MAPVASVDTVGDAYVGSQEIQHRTQTILITGSSSGLGRATAKHFHAKGWNVVATMRNPGREQELTRLDRVLVTRLDVQDTAPILAAVDAGVSEFGRIDPLVNNAGYGAYGPLEVTSLDKIRRQFDVNVLRVLATTKALLPHFRANRNGVIVNISSGGGRVTFPLGTLYHGTKFAVEGLSSQLRYEVGVDVVELLGRRRSADDATFLGGMRALFGLEG